VNTLQYIHTDLSYFFGGLVQIKVPLEIDEHLLFFGKKTGGKKLFPSEICKKQTAIIYQLKLQ
jgi:hypothetical protein